MKMTSRIALVAAAGFLIGATTQAKAADLGGGCCADLEERVAELEATTARKGNRVVSLQVYGQVSRALLIWDDGVDSDIYNVDNDLSSTRLGFQGSGTLKPDVTAGFKIEFNVQEADASVVDQIDSDANDSGQDVAFDIRYAYAYVESATLGRITLGQQSESTDGITEINLGGSGSAVDGNIGAGFFVRDSIVPGNDDNNVRWGTLLDTSDGDRVNAIRYDSPSLYGFILSASFAEDDRYDVALRFSKEWNSIRLAAGIGYRLEETDFKSLDTVTGIDENETVAGSISVMHVPTGLYAMFSASDQTTEFVDGSDDADQSMWYVQGGITKNWLGYGNTTFYAAYGETEFDSPDGVGGGAGPVNIDGLAITTADTTQWGLGVVQAFDSAATEVFVHYVHYETDAFGFDIGGLDDDAATEDFDAILTGITIKF